MCVSCRNVPAFIFVRRNGFSFSDLSAPNHMRRMNIYQKYGVLGVMLAVLGIATFAAAQTTDTDTDSLFDDDTVEEATTSPDMDDDDATTDTEDADTTPLPTSTTGQTLAVAAPGEYPAPMVIDIDDAGNALIRGTVQSTGSDSITITTWGGTWTIQTDDGDSVVPAGTTGTDDLSAIRVGDFVGAEGTVSTGNAMTLDARFVRDWTTNPFTGTAGVGVEGGTGSAGTSTDTGTGTGGTGPATTPTTPTTPSSPSPSPSPSPLY
jgi:hypothetical protein